MPGFSLVRTLLSGVTHLVYPNTCWTCGHLMPPEQRHVCLVCLPKLTIDPFSTCPRCSSTVGPHLALDEGCPDCRDQKFAFAGAFRMAPYEDLLRQTILRMKHWAGEDLAEVIGTIWARRMKKSLNSLQADLVVPVPLHWRRRWQRGFNQAATFAHCLAKELAIPCWPRALRRVRATTMQTAQSSATARRENVQGAFQARADVADHTVLLVDDVLTSGATASEAARALIAGKAKAVYVAVLAHGH